MSGQSVFSHLAGSYLCSISAASWRRSATLATKKRKFTLFLEHSIANTCATYRRWARTRKASYRCASFLKTYCKPTSLKCAITWTCLVFNLWELCSHGFSTHLWMYWRLTSCFSFMIGFWDSNHWKCYLSQQQQSSRSAQTWSSTARTRMNSTNCSLICLSWRLRPFCSTSSSQPEWTDTCGRASVH